MTTVERQVAARCQVGMVEFIGVGVGALSETIYLDRITLRSQLTH